jgi:hypothetical protein
MPIAVIVSSMLPDFLLNLMNGQQLGRRSSSEKPVIHAIPHDWAVDFKVSKILGVFLIYPFLEIDVVINHSTFGEETKTCLHIFSSDSVNGQLWTPLMKPVDKQSVSRLAVSFEGQGPLEDSLFESVPLIAVVDIGGDEIIDLTLEKLELSDDNDAKRLLFTEA